MSKRLNPNLAKIHRNYTVEEITDLFGVHKNTVRAWLRAGLPACDDNRPILVLGCELRTFLQGKKTKNKQKCKPYQIYCVRCKSPQHPAGNMVEYRAINDLRGCLVGICPVCDGMMNRFAARAKLAQIEGYLDVTMPTPQKHLNYSDKLPINCDFK